MQIHHFLAPLQLLG